MLKNNETTAGRTDNLPETISPAGTRLDDRQPKTHEMKPYDTEEFRTFLAPETNRHDWICQWLTKHDIPHSTIPTGNQLHILVEFPKENYDERYKLKTVLAHYDRLCIGANDNSSCVYQILHWILRLKENYKKEKTHNLYIIFTDGEELGVGKSNEKPGVLGIASFLNRSELKESDVFAIDSCGRGDTLIVSSAGKENGTLKFKTRFKDLYDRAIELAKFSCGDDWLTMPTFYGDNAGCILVGIPSVAITVLPKEEAVKYMRSLQRFPNLYEKMMNHILTDEEQNTLPLTWQMMHTKADCIENLTDESWPLMEKVLDGLARIRKKI